MPFSLHRAELGSTLEADTEAFCCPEPRQLHRGLHMWRFNPQWGLEKILVVQVGLLEVL